MKIIKIDCDHRFMPASDIMTHRWFFMWENKDITYIQFAEPFIKENIIKGLRELADNLENKNG